MSIARGGVPILVIGLTLAATSGAVMKLLADDLPPMLIVWYRFTGFSLLILPLALWRFRGAALRPIRPGIQALRGLCLASATSMFLAGALTIDFAEAVAVLYAYPFLIALLAPLILGEPTRRAAWFGVAGGFCGVLIVLRPSLEGLGNPGAGWILACSVAVAVQLMLNRKLGPFVEPMLTALWGAVVAALALTLLLPFVWHIPTLSQLGLLVVLAALAATSQTLFAMAFARSPAAELAPFAYSEIVAGVVLGWLMFDTVPDAISWVGIGVIVASGLVVARVQQGRITPRRQPKI